MHKCTLSIVIPVYNNEYEVRETVAPILKTLENIGEIVFINDGSTDCSQQVLEQIRDENSNIPITIYNQRNSGVSVARNRGLELARGKYIYFCDADDLLDDKLVCRLLEKVRYESDVIFWKHNIKRNNKLYNLQYNDIDTDFEGRVLDVECLLKYIMDDGFRLCMGAYAVKKEYLEQYGIWFTEGCQYGEDLEFILKIIINTNKICYIPHEMYTYVRRDNSAMGKYTIKRFDAAQMIVRILEYIEGNGIDISLGNKEYLAKEYLIKHFIYSMEFCLQFLGVSEYYKFWNQIKTEYPELCTQVRQMIKRTSLKEIGYTQKRMIILKWNIQMYSFWMMLKNSLKRIMKGCK